MRRASCSAHFSLATAGTKAATLPLEPTIPQGFEGLLRETPQPVSPPKSLPNHGSQAPPPLPRADLGTSLPLQPLRSCLAPSEEVWKGTDPVGQAEAGELGRALATPRYSLPCPTPQLWSPPGSPATSGQMPPWLGALQTQMARRRGKRGCNRAALGGQEAATLLREEGRRTSQRLAPVS